MTPFQFGLEVAPAPTGGSLRALFDRCDDATVEHDAPSGRTRIHFDRVAPSLVDAVVSGVRDLDHAGLVTHGAVPDDDLITGAGVAARLGPVRQAAEWLLDGGMRSPGGPRPVWMCTEEPLYRWTDVVAWLWAHDHARMIEPAAGGEAGEAMDVVFEAVGLALRLRALAARVDRMALIRSLIDG